MYKKTALFFAVMFYLVHSCCYAQLHPSEDSKLHYRLVGFSFPGAAKANNYVLEISNGNTNDEAIFKRNLVKSINSKENKIIAEVPAFNAQYTWRVISDNKAGEFHHFTTLGSPVVDTSVYRLRIKLNPTKYSDAFVFTDGNKTLYDMHGNPIWFLPNIKTANDQFSVIRDLKITPQNTITFVSFNTVYEINYEGEILWTGPNTGEVSGDTSEHYHHELTRLKNGHYMVLGHENLPWEWKYGSKGDSSVSLTHKQAKQGNTSGVQKFAEMGTVIEYDAAGKVVWSWKSSSYFRGEKLKEIQIPAGLREIHENAFYFDEKNKFLYVSFKNIDQVLKVKYPEGKVVDAYDGYELTELVGGSQLSLFSEQHSCKINDDGDLYLFNNNMANMYSAPNVLILKQPATPNGQLKKVWGYEYPDKNHTLKRDPLTSGGNVIELPDHSMFVSECVPYANIFIVSRDKQLLWDAVLEKKNDGAKEWEERYKPFPQYRASIITDPKRLTQLIWKSIPGN